MPSKPQIINECTHSQTKSFIYSIRALGDLYHVSKAFSG